MAGEMRSDGRIGPLIAYQVGQATAADMAASQKGPLMQIIRHLSALGVVTLIAASVGGAELTRLESLAPVRGCGCAIDPATGEIFVTSCNSIVIEVYSSEGERLRSYWQPTSGGLAQEHVDLDFVSHPIELGGAAVPGGSLLLINGNDLAAEVYALDPFDGTVHGTLSTAFGDGRVSGGAYHPSRGTIFLLQNRFAPTLVTPSPRSIRQPEPC